MIEGDSRSQFTIARPFSRHFWCSRRWGFAFAPPALLCIYYVFYVFLILYSFLFFLISRARIWKSEWKKNRQARTRERINQFDDDKCSCFWVLFVCVRVRVCVCVCVYVCVCVCVWERNFFRKKFQVRKLHNLIYIQFFFSSSLSHTHTHTHIHTPTYRHFLRKVLNTR